MRSIFESSSTQIAENLIGIATGNGFTLPHGITRKTFARKIKQHVSVEPDPHAEQDPQITNFFNTFLEVERIRNEFARQLKRVAANPKMYGIDRDWRLTQREALEAIIKCIEAWVTRPLIEIPTGVGKSMVWGGVMRAFHDTLRIFGLEDQIEIVLLTSRINIADQMIEKKVQANKVDKEYETDDALEYGDIKEWFMDLPEDKIRILAGRSGSKKEVAKNAFITLMCYQSLRPHNMAKFFKKKTGLVIPDESHRISNAIRIVLENQMSTAFFIGGSATTKGHRHNQPFKFFESVASSPDAPHAEHLAYYASIITCGHRQELKKVRYLNSRGSIDLSQFTSRSRLDLPQREVESFVAKSIPTMKAILEEVFLGEHPVLDMAGSKKPHERKWLAFVDRVATAEELADWCNKFLAPRIKEVHGSHVRFVTDFVKGTMKRTEFKEHYGKFQTGETTFMFNAEKLGEGADVPDVNGVISFRAYGKNSAWKLIQEIGRGTRYIPNDDLLYIDGVFKSQSHDLASPLSIFGIENYVSGGLIIGLKGEREAEMKAFKLLKEGMSWKEVWSKLTERERELIPFVNIRAKEADLYKHIKPAGKTTTPLSVSLPQVPEKSLASSIQFVENPDLKIQYDFADKEKLVLFVNNELKDKGIIDLDSLLNTNTLDLRKLKLPHVGSLMVVYALFFGGPRKDCLSKDDLLKLAQALGWEISKGLSDYSLNDWFSANGIYNQLGRGKDLLIARKTIKNFAEKYRKSKPEWFKDLSLKAGHGAEHYHPELVKLIKQELFDKAKPKGWESWSNIPRLLKIGTSSKGIDKFVAPYRLTNPDWFKKFLIRTRDVECYHPDLVKLIKQHFKKE